MMSAEKDGISGEEYDAEDKLWLWRYSRPKEFEARVDALLNDVRASKRGPRKLVTTEHRDAATATR